MKTLGFWCLGQLPRYKTRFVKKAEKVSTEINIPQNISIFSRLVFSSRKPSHQKMSCCCLQLPASLIIHWPLPNAKSAFTFLHSLEAYFIVAFMNPSNFCNNPWSRCFALCANIRKYELFPVKTLWSRHSVITLTACFPKKFFGQNIISSCYISQQRVSWPVALGDSFALDKMKDKKTNTTYLPTKKRCSLRTRKKLFSFLV